MCMPIFGKTCNLLENKKTIIILEMIIKIVTVIIIIIIIIKIIISDVARIYVPRKKGGRGRISCESCARREEKNLSWYV